jgi:hypothetical protein
MAEVLVDSEPKELSLIRKLVLLTIFCLAQFLDVVCGSALFSAIPSLSISMGMTESQSTWVISAFQLTFSSFLLIVRVHPVNSDLHYTLFRVAASVTCMTQVCSIPPLCGTC